MQDCILIVDCQNFQHKVKIDNVKSIESFYNRNEKRSITTVHFKQIDKNLLDIKTYELADNLRLRFSKLYDESHKND